MFALFNPPIQLSELLSFNIVIYYFSFDFFPALAYINDTIAYNKFVYTFTPQRRTTCAYLRMNYITSVNNGPFCKPCLRCTTEEALRSDGKNQFKMDLCGESSWRQKH